MPSKKILSLIWQKKLPGRLVCLGLYGVIRHAYEIQNFLENCAVNLKLLVVRNSYGFDKFEEYEEFARELSSKGKRNYSKRI